MAEENFIKTVVTVALLVCVVIFVTLGGGTSAFDARKALETNGFSDVAITGTSGWVNGCGSGETAYYAKAKNPVGKPVEVVACVGWGWKGSTVRVR